MGRLVALDVGRKRTGIAATDLMKIIPSPIGYMPTSAVAEWLADYCTKEPVDALVVGAPRQADNTESESVKYIVPLLNRIRKLLPNLEIVHYDERYTSVLAQRSIIASGVPKEKRKEKGLVDEVSAVIILRDFMESKSGLPYMQQKR